MLNFNWGSVPRTQTAEFPPKGKVLRATVRWMTKPFRDCSGKWNLTHFSPLLPSSCIQKIISLLSNSCCWSLPSFFSSSEQIWKYWIMHMQWEFKMYIKIPLHNQFLCKVGINHHAYCQPPNHTFLNRSSFKCYF